MENYALKATDLHQYDSKELDWRIGGDINSPSRVFFRNNLRKNLEDLHGKSVLDIGSGVGHLFPMLSELGASHIEAFDPSERNVEYSRKLYPQISIHRASLEECLTSELFNVAICVMAFEHVPDIKKAFMDVNRLIKSGGSFYLIFGDKDFHSTSDPPRTIVDIQDMGNGNIATKTIRDREGVISAMYDIFRPVDSFIKSAEVSGFTTIKKEDFLAKPDGNVQFWAGRPICHLLVLKKI